MIKTSSFFSVHQGSTCKSSLHLNLIILTDFHSFIVNVEKLKWLKGRVSLTLRCRKCFLSITDYFQHILNSKSGRFGQLWKPKEENFYQHEKLKLDAVRMRTISSEDIGKRHAVVRELWSRNSAYSISFWPCHQIQLEWMSIVILFWDMTSIDSSQWHRLA